MSHFGITAIRWNSSRTEVASCKVHRVGKVDEQVFLNVGYEASHAEVASLIIGGHKVWVMQDSAHSAFRRTRPVKVRRREENLFTVPASSLIELAEF